jgi:hypothetical protein
VNKDRVDNGSILTVTGFGKNGEIEAKTATGLRRVLPSGFQHWTHAAVLTTFAAQGKSKRQVFVSMPRSTFGAVNPLPVRDHLQSLEAIIICGRFDGSTRCAVDAYAHRQ